MLAFYKRQAYGLDTDTGCAQSFVLSDCAQVLEPNLNLVCFRVSSREQRFPETRTDAA